VNVDPQAKKTGDGEKPGEKPFATCRKTGTAALGFRS
jgi:hypothetical protein